MEGLCVNVHVFYWLVYLLGFLLFRELKSLSCLSRQILVQKVLRGLVFLVILYHLRPMFSFPLQQLHLQQ
jgi:hypothetical protein